MSDNQFGTGLFAGLILGIGSTIGILVLYNGLDKKGKLDVFKNEIKKIKSNFNIKGGKK